MKNLFKIVCVLALAAGVPTSAGAAASRFALAAQEGDLPRALDGLSKVTQQCVACHSTYRVQ